MLNFIRKEVDYSSAIIMLLGVCPSIIISILLHNSFYLSSAFFSACALTPYCRQHHNKWLTYFHLMLIFIGGVSADLLIGHWIYFTLYLSIISLILGVLDTHKKEMRVFASWVLIGVIYSGFKFHYEYSVVFNQLPLILIISVLSCFLAMLGHANHSINLNKIKLYSNFFDFLIYFKYLIAVVVTVMIWHIYKVPEPEWLIWSSLSVVVLEIGQSKKKLLLRLKGGVLGVVIGVFLVHIIPDFAWSHAVYFIIVAISFVAFSRYLLAFIIRCSTIVLYGGLGGYTLIGMERLTNVIIGGTVGFIVVQLILLIRKLGKPKYC